MTTTCSLIFKLPADYRVLVYLKLIYPRQFTVPKQREAIIFHTVLSRRVTKERFLKSRRSIPRCCACRRWVTLESSVAECTTRHVLTTLSPALSEFAKTTKRESHIYRHCNPITHQFSSHEATKTIDNCLSNTFIQLPPNYLFSWL